MSGEVLLEHYSHLPKGPLSEILRSSRMSLHLLVRCNMVVGLASGHILLYLEIGLPSQTDEVEWQSSGHHLLVKVQLPEYN